METMNEDLKESISKISDVLHQELTIVTEKHARELGIDNKKKKPAYKPVSV